MTMPAVQANTKMDRVARTFRQIKADSSGNLPTTIEVLQVGMWQTPWHGDFMITPDNLQEYVDNFNAGIGIVSPQLGAPIDFSHNNESIAAGWIKGLEVVGDTLVATVEWTVAGAEALTGGMFKCFSPEFFPLGRGGWQDPEDYNTVVNNVLVGGGLTNIPLFTGLEPVMASKSSGKSNKNKYDDVIFIKASNAKEKKMATIEEVRAKLSKEDFKVDQLTEEEKTFVTEHKDDLTANEQKAAGIEVTPVTAAPADTPITDPTNTNNEPKGDQVPTPEAASPELAAVAASIKSGESVVVKASTLKRLEETDQEFRLDKAKAVVTAHIARGALKADQLKPWSEKLVAADTAEREGLEKLLTDLPSNQLMASSLGSDKDSAEVQDELVAAKTLAKLQASREAGKPIRYSQARREVEQELKNGEAK